MDKIQKTDEYVEYIHTKYGSYLSKILIAIIIIIILMILVVCGNINTNEENYLSKYIAVYSLLTNLVLIIFIKKPTYSFLGKGNIKKRIWAKTAGILAGALILFICSVFIVFPLSYREFKERTEIREEHSKIEYGILTADNMMAGEKETSDRIISFSSGICIAYPYDEKIDNNAKYPAMKTKKIFIFPNGREEDVEFYQFLFVDEAPTIGKGSGNYQFYMNTEEIYRKAYDEYKNPKTSLIIFNLFLFLTVLIPAGAVSSIFLISRYRYENM